MRTLVGVHLHATQKTDMERLYEERYPVFLMLDSERGHYLGPLMAHYRSKGWPLPLILIRQHQVPQLRGYHEWRGGGDWQREIEDHADKFVEIAREIHDAFGIWPEAIPWNETNLPLEESGGSSLTQFLYCAMAFPLYYHRVKASCPEVLVHWPAWSPGNRDDDDRFVDAGGTVTAWDYDGISICAEAIELADVVDIHAYMGGTWAPGYWTTYRHLRPVGYRDQYDLGGIVPRFPHKAFALLEWNAENPRSNEPYWRDRYVEFHNALYDGIPRLAESTYYTWADDDPEQQAWELQGSETLISALRRADLYISQHPKEVIVVPEPTGWDAIWETQVQALSAYPALAKAALAANLGPELSHEYDQQIDGVAYRFQRYLGGIVYCRLGDWGNVRVARQRSELLPFV